MTKQAHLFSNGKENPTYVAKGPIFDNRRRSYPPGKYIAIIAITGAIGISITTYFVFQGSFRSPHPITQSTNISQLVIRNDNQTKLARRAIASYLEQHIDVALSNAQKLFIETSLAQARKNSRLQVGTSVEFSMTEIESLIEKSKDLTAIQIKAWSDLAKNVKF